MLILVRHGQTTRNLEGRLSGRVDVELTPLGIRQADALASAVRMIGRPDLVISSPLLRARQTASAFGVAIQVDPRWIELDYGELEGRLPAEVPQAVWQRWRADTSFAPEGGESMAEVAARVRQACSETIEAATDGLIVVVTHVSPIKATAAWALGVDDSVVWRMFVAPASLTRIAVRQGVPSLHSFNETAHLLGC